MIIVRHIAQEVAQVTPKDADRYDQIYAIKQELISHGFELFATDRETIDGILDILFDEYSFSA